MGNGWDGKKVVECMEGGWPEGGIALWDEGGWSRLESCVGVGVQVLDGFTGQILREAWEGRGGWPEAVPGGGEGGASRDVGWEGRVVSIGVLNGHGECISPGAGQESPSSSVGMISGSSFRPKP
jgi:hypothetical protein